MRKASAPSAARSTAKPSAARISLVARRNCGSSSTTAPLDICITDGCQLEVRRQSDNFVEWQSDSTVANATMPPADPGVLVLPVGPRFGAQVLVRLQKRGGEVRREELDPVRFVPMVGG